MRNITINLPNAYLKLLEDLSQKIGTSRSELIRRAIRDRVQKDLPFLHLINKLHPEIDLELKKKKILEFFNYCIVCNKRLHYSKQPYKCKNLEILELRFCCSCFKKVEGKSFNQLPNRIISKIQKKLEEYKKQLRKT
ncbi:MAG: ribbon-helix-helix protein, CopG family [Promethearchaeota archaeon]